MLNYLQIILAITLTTAILMQAKGAGLSGVFGGAGNVYRSKRGAERTLFIFTVINAVLFFLIAIINAL